MALSVIHMHRMTKRFSLLMHLFPAKVKQGDAVYSCFSFSDYNKYPFHVIECNFFFFACFVLFVGDFIV